jgi:hypothetical protein
MPASEPIKIVESSGSMMGNGHMLYETPPTSGANVHLTDPFGFNAVTFALLAPFFRMEK